MHIIKHVTVHSHTHTVEDEDLTAVRRLLERGILTGAGRGSLSDYINVAAVEITPDSIVSIHNPLPEDMYPLSQEDIRTVSQCIKVILSDETLATTNDLSVLEPPAIFLVTRHNIQIKVVKLDGHHIVQNLGQKTN